MNKDQVRFVRGLFWNTEVELGEYHKEIGRLTSTPPKDEWNNKRYSIDDEDKFRSFYTNCDYDIALAGWHSRRRARRWYRIHTINRILSLFKHRTVMDYGSGIGTDSLALTYLGYKVGYYDINEGVLAFHKWRQQRYGLYSDFGVADADTLLMYDVIEHLPSPYEYIKGLVTDCAYRLIIMTQAFNVGLISDPFHTTKYNMRGVYSSLEEVGYYKLPIEGVAFPPLVMTRGVGISRLDLRDEVTE